MIATAKMAVVVIGVVLGGVASVGLFAQSTAQKDGAVAPGRNGPVIQPLSAYQLVDEYERALSPLSRVTYMAESKSVSFGNGKRYSAKQYGLAEDEQGRMISRSHVRRDGNRLDILELKPGVVEGLETWQKPELYRYRLIVDNSLSSVDYGTTADGQPARVRRRGAVSLSHAGVVTVAGTVRMEVSLSLGGGESLDGIMYSRRDKTLPEILRSCSDLRVRPLPEVLDGHFTCVVECTDVAGYAYTVWIDPAASFLPRQILQRKLNREAEGADLRVDAIQIEQIAGNFVAVSAHIKLENVSDTKYRFSSESDYRRWDIDFNPDFGKLGAFKMIVPPGTDETDH